MARVTGLEPAASGVTGRRSNQLSYAPKGRVAGIKTENPLVKALSLTGGCKKPLKIRENSWSAARESSKRQQLQVFYAA